MSVIAAIASALRGEKFIHEDEESKEQKARLTVRALAVPGDDGVAAHVLSDSTVEPAGNGVFPGEPVRSTP
jgi:hypothetical protein